MEEDEQIRDALHREVREELGLSVTDERPVTFRDLLREKTFPDGRTQLVYMIFLIFECRVAAGDVRLNDEHVEYAWVEPTELERYDLDPYTEETLRLAGILSRGPQC